jgi:hypothetical protein
MFGWRRRGENAESPRETRGNFPSAIYFCMMIIGTPRRRGRGVAMLLSSIAVAARPDEREAVFALDLDQRGVDRGREARIVELGRGDAVGLGGISGRARDRHGGRAMRNMLSMWSLPDWGCGSLSCWALWRRSAGCQSDFCNRIGEQND